jgi:hypothetical protein
MTSTLKERTKNGKALSVNGIEIGTQSLESDGLVYCEIHGFVKSAWGQCEECFDAGLRDFDATRIAKLLIPSWVGLDVTGRQVILARVHDAVEAVEKISLYKNSDAIVLVIWGSVITPLENGKIGLSWTLGKL